MIDQAVGIDINKVESLKLPLKSKSYLLFCHSSYEDRCLSLKRYSFGDSEIVRSIQISSKEYLSNKVYSQNKALLENFTNEISLHSQIPIIADRDQPIELLFSIESILNKLEEKYDGFLLDISTFPRDRLICLLDYLMKIRGAGKSIEFIYTSPKNYSTESENGWLTRGVRKISPLPRFNGKQRTRKDSLLIMLLGHEGERSHITLKNIEPDKLIVITQGSNQLNDKAQDISYKENSPIFDEYSVLNIIEVPYADPTSTSNILESLYQKYKDDYNLIVSINGTKLQVLGAMITCMRHREIQIVYAYPQVYNIDSYSVSESDSYYGLFNFA